MTHLKGLKYFTKMGASTYKWGKSITIFIQFKKKSLFL